MILAHRIRLDPNSVQQTWLERCAGAARFAYNWGLARWRDQYAASEQPNWYKLNVELNARKKTDLAWLCEIPWKVASQALENLGSAFGHFFRRVKLGENPGYPRFKKKGRCRDGFSIEARRLVFDERRVRVPKLGWLRMREIVRFPGKILSARFSKRADHWYVSVQIEVDASWIYPHCETQAVVGVDLGVVDLAVLSSGERVRAPRALRKAEPRLRLLNKELHRRKRGGANRERTRAKLARLHERVANIRRDVTHKLTTSLVRRFRYIGVEDLHVVGLQRSRLAKSVSDAAMGEVLRQLAYKAPLAGADLIVADRWFPSSKVCSTCGVVREKLALGERRWTCTSCGVEHDRDENAAKNLRDLAAAYAVTACRHGSAGTPRSTKLPSGQEGGVHDSSTGRVEVQPADDRAQAAVGDGYGSFR